MTKKFTVSCDFSGKEIPIDLYVGEPENNHHPLHFQNNWLSKERGGVIPTHIMESMEKLHTIAIQNNVPFEDLCQYAINASSTPESKLAGNDNEAAAQKAHNQIDEEAIKRQIEQKKSGQPEQQTAKHTEEQAKNPAANERTENAGQTENTVEKPAQRQEAQQSAAYEAENASQSQSSQKPAEVIKDEAVKEAPTAQKTPDTQEVTADAATEKTTLNQETPADEPNKPGEMAEAIEKVEKPDT